MLLIIGSNFIGIMAKPRDTWVDAEEKEHSANENKLQKGIVLYVLPHIIEKRHSLWLKDKIILCEILSHLRSTV